MNELAVPQKGSSYPNGDFLVSAIMITLQSLSLGDALFSKTQQKVFNLLFAKHDQSFSNEIVRWVGLGKGTIMRELERLNAAGLINRVQIDNQN